MRSVAQYVEGGDLSPVLNTTEAATGLLYSFLSSTDQQGSGDTAKGHENSERPEIFFQ